MTVAREAIPTWCFAMAVVRLGRRVLLVRERKHGQGWYLPAGRVERGETFYDAAVRETREEAGVAIAVEGVLRVEHTPSSDGARMRVFVLARAVDDTPPKSVADEHSLEARWVTLDEVDALPLRGVEVREIVRAVLDGAFVAPRSLLAEEGARW